MKLLFDPNLSPKLVDRLAGLFDSVHVFDTGPARFTSDEAIIVAADSDFLDFVKNRGAPPLEHSLQPILIIRSP